MASIYSLKPAFQNLLRPLTRFLNRLGVTANQVTTSTMLLSIALALFVIWQYQQSTSALIFLAIPIWMFIRMALNAIDGMLAREFNQQTQLGAYLNELCDVISDTALYGCFFVLSAVSTPLLCSILFLAILTEYAGVMAPLIGQARRYDGPMGKSDRAFCFSIIALFVAIQPYFVQYISFHYLGTILSIVFICINLLLILTIYNRVKNAIFIHEN